jgi:ribosomal protein S18 acetylase RimI-like enzyme
MTVIDPTTTIRRARPADRAVLNRVLASAFADDPVFNWIVPDEATLARTIEPCFDIFAEAFARHDETHLLTTVGVTSAAVMLAPPGVAPIHPDDDEAVGEKVAALLPDHIERFGTCMGMFEAVHPEQPAWYVQFIGVHAPEQGRGLGSILLRDVTSRADAAGEPAYLEATSERNRALYERHGFEVTSEIALPDGPTAYGMWREPRSHRRWI